MCSIPVDDYSKRNLGESDKNNDVIVKNDDGTATRDQ